MLHSNPNDVSGSGHIANQTMHLTLASICKDVPLSSGSSLDAADLSCDSSNTSHGTSRLVLAMSAWLVKTRLVRSRHCRNAKICGHTITAMHDMGTPPPPRLPLLP